jgi:xylan 1,4-beta-xylosidase
MSKGLKTLIIFTACAIVPFIVPAQDMAKQGVTICNPVNLSYRFCLDSPSRREAADPTIVVYKNEYYLFASKSGGYFHSTDLVSWDLITSKDLPLEDYAPTAVVIRDSLFFMASGPAPVKIYKTADPKSGKWQLANAAFPIGMIDPDLFLDDDGRLFFYYGCSNINPLYAVELDPYTFRPLGKPVALLNSDKAKNGWERKGEYNETAERPWIEGSWMNKYKGRYYLQYAGPGTEFKSYADGLYTADKPLGPYTPAVHNPVSYKPEGFVAGAGHSNTFTDKYGNYWHISTMTISQKHMFERRLGLFPAFFDQDGVFYVYTGFGDFPMKMPAKKIQSPAELFPGWMLLSYKKPVSVSSSLAAYPSSYASDEDIRTYWSAATGEKGEWLTMDLQKTASVHAVQINYAENDTRLYGRTDKAYYQYLLEYSSDGKTWKILKDRTNDRQDLSHDYVALTKPVRARYIRITNYHMPSGTFALAGLRVFGKAPGKETTAAKAFSVVRTASDRCIATLRWQASPGATGYNIRYGTDRNKLYHNYQVLGADSLIIRSLQKDTKYYFTIDAFNETGITKSSTLVELD